MYILVVESRVNDKEPSSPKNTSLNHAIYILPKLIKAMTKWKRKDGSNTDIQQSRAITNLS